MKNIFKFICIGALATLLVACGSQATPTAIPTITLDNTQTNSSSSGGKASASAIVVPAEKVELAFAIPGNVKTVNVAEGDSVTVNQPLVALDAGILEARVRQAEANVTTAEAQVAYLVRSGTSQENLDSARADVERAKASLEIAKIQLSQATLNAPIDGTIASINVSPAEYVNPAQVVVTMGNLTHFIIETTDMSEKDVPSVQIGQPATVYIEALNTEFSGKVIDIARISETVGGDVVYTVKIELDEQPAGLRWGMSAEVSIETE
jgi:RND family efflux transporter MFP subunit